MGSFWLESGRDAIRTRASVGEVRQGNTAARLDDPESTCGASRLRPNNAQLPEAGKAVRVGGTCATGSVRRVRNVERRLGGDARPGRPDPTRLGVRFLP